jgi:hydrogenase maturation protease
VAEATRDPLPSPACNGTSTHAFSVSAAIERARTLDRLPERLVVIGIEGRDFAVGAPLSAKVQTAVATSAARVLSMLDELGSPAT